MLTQVKKVLVLKGPYSSSLISFSQLFDDRCKVILDERHCFVMKYSDFILQGKINLTDNLWDIALTVKNKSKVPQSSKDQGFTVFWPIPEHSFSVIIRQMR